jgi:hypothetical protein
MTAIPSELKPLAMVVLAVTLALSGCSQEPVSLETDRLSQDDCLQEVKVDELAQALKLCDQVVSSFPRDARPLSDRFVLHTLNGDLDKACQDIEKAAALLKANAADQAAASAGDPQLETDIRVRRESCRDLPAPPPP